MCKSEVQLGSWKGTSARNDEPHSLVLDLLQLHEVLQNHFVKILLFYFLPPPRSSISYLSELTVIFMC